ncbi:HAD family hydrolase [Azospirillum palustre]
MPPFTILERQPLLVSFDVFDTLLLRREEQPADLFEAVGERALAAGLVDPGLTPVLFRLAREEAERRARTGLASGEVGLAAIHAELRHLLCETADPAMLAALELEVEAERIFANPLLLAVLRELSAAGIPVVLLSDMYLAPADLARLLAAAGIGPELYGRLYVSGTEGCSKRDGGLFRLLLAAHPGIPPGRIIHIGDDPLGDAAMARAAGLEAIHYVPGPGLARLRERERSLSGLAAEAPPPPRRLAALAGREDDAAGAFALEFGTLVLGPAVAEYCRWVVEECRRQGIRRIAPLMREAALFAPLMRDWIAHRGYAMEVVALHLSRQALMPLELAGLNAAAARRILGQRPHLPWDRLLVQAGGEVPATLLDLAGLTLEELLAKPVTDGGSAVDRVLALFDDPELRSRAARLAEEARERLLDYLAQVLGREEPVALVDLGARGSTPAAVARLLPEGRRRCRIFLAYAVADIVAALADGIRVQIFAGQDRTGMALGRVLYRSPQILERVLTGLDGTTVGHRRNADGRVVPLLAQPPAAGEERQLLALLQQGIRRYAGLMTAVYPARGEMAVTGVQALLPLAAALLRPTAQEADILGGLAYDQNDGTEGERVLCDATALAAVQPLAEMGEGPVLALALGLRPALAPWPQGALTRLVPGIFHQPADRLGLEGGHGPVCRALVERLRGRPAGRFGILAVGGDGGMGPDFIRYAREAGLEPAAYADLMNHLVPPPLFHGVAVRDMGEMAALGMPLVLVTLGYADRLAGLMRDQAAAGGLLPPRLIALGRPDLERD